ncbi:MAG: hypothetical protein R3B13_24840 [Polyangiaceae bacterium]
MALRFRTGLAAALFCLAAGPQLSHAQSAADKATARQLAMDGVEAFRKQDFAAALDKLQRAQNLYDAPVHLIYIARASAKLGKLVEAAEAYRRLVRTRLEANAPEAFREAVDDAKKELPELEPRIPKLRIDVSPADLDGLEVKLGTTVVPTAALGVDRPTNPGSLTVTASAPGFHDAQQSIELGEGQTKALSLTLEPNPSAKTGTDGAGGTGGESSGAGGGGGSKKEPGKLGFVLGLRVMGISPAGTAFETSGGDLGSRKLEMSELYGPGGGAELRGGVRFLRYFTGHLIGGAYGVKSGAEFDKVATPLESMDAESQSLLTEFGIGVSAGTPPGQLGAFGELDLMLVHNFTTTRKLSGTDEGPPLANLSCDEQWLAKGGGIRLAAGANVPLSRQFQLTPIVGVTLGAFSDFTVSGCDKRTPQSVAAFGGSAKEYPVIDGLILSGQERESPTHTVAFLGVGVDWLFGSDIPSE